MPPFEGVLYVQDRTSGVHEVINQSRAAAYLADPDLAIDGLSICDILDFGGCEAYASDPYCGAPYGGYVDLPGTAGNNLSVPDAADLDITGDIAVIIDMAMADWSPTAVQVSTSKADTGSQISWVIQHSTAGGISFYWSVDGVSLQPALSSTALGFTNGSRHMIALCFDVDDGAGNRRAYFWESPDDGATWSAIGGGSASAAGTTSIHAGTAPVRISSYLGGQHLAAAVYSVSIRNGITAAFKPGGTEVFRFDGPVDLHGIDSSATSFTASTGETITVNRSGTPSTTLVPYVDVGDWLPLVFDSPATDPAPWYNANYPQSADALGFYITAWTGLDDGHLKRASSPIGSYGGGSRLSPISSDGRVMKLNIIIFGRTNEATEYLFRWLASTLSSICSTCDTPSILIRRYCPSGVDLWDGAVQLRRVGLVEGLKWEADLVERGACYMRQASFTLEAGDPCMYLPDTDRPVNAMDADADVDACLAGLTLDPDREFCRPSCSELTANCRTIRTFEVDPLGAMAPVITWTNTQNSYTYPFRALIYADPGETGAVPNPCGLRLLGEMYVRALPPYSSMRWDITGRTVEYSDHTTGGWVPGWAYTTANDPPTRKFFALSCGMSQLVMEPASMCAEEVDADTFTLDGTIYDPPRFPTVSIRMSERIGCV